MQELNTRLLRQLFWNSHPLRSCGSWACPEDWSTIHQLCSGGRCVVHSHIHRAGLPWELQALGGGPKGIYGRPGKTVKIQPRLPKSFETHRPHTHSQQPQAGSSSIPDTLHSLSISISASVSFHYCLSLHHHPADFIILGQCPSSTDQVQGLLFSSRNFTLTGLSSRPTLPPSLLSLPSYHQFRRTSQKINILDEILCVSLYPSNFIICFYGKKGPNLSKISIF